MRSFDPLQLDPCIVSPETLHAFDTETMGFSSHLLYVSISTPTETYGEGANLGADHEHESARLALWLLIEMEETFSVSNPPTWIAHNLGFDLRYVHDLMLEYWGPRYQLRYGVRSRSSIFGLDVLSPDAKGKLKVCARIRDSMAVWPGSLRTLAETFLPADQRKLSIDVTHFDPMNAEHIAYALRDAEALRKSYLLLSEELQRTFNVNIRSTVSSTAKAAWRGTITESYECEPSIREYFSRSAYYGGYVGIFDRSRHEDAKTYDINSSYPAAMLQGVPDPSSWSSSQELRFDCAGIYEVEIHARPDLPIAVLPARQSDDTVLYPLGNFHTICTSIELEEALAWGYQIDVLGGVCYENTIYPFTSFIETCMEIRQKYKGQPRERLAKLLQNSLYGMFGLKRDRWEYRHKIGQKRAEWVQVRKPVTAMPLWAAWITARARVNLFTTIREIGIDHVLYCDTDSITIDGEAVFPAHKIDSAEYGKWKLEKEWEWFRARAPKVYSGKIKGSHALHGAIKGIPLRRISEVQDILAAVERDDIIEVDGIEFVTSFGAFTRSGIFVRSGKRRVTDAANVRGRDIDMENGKVRPIIMGGVDG